MAGTARTGLQSKRSIGALGLPAATTWAGEEEIEQALLEVSLNDGLRLSAVFGVDQKTAIRYVVSARQLHGSEAEDQWRGR